MLGKVPTYSYERKDRVVENNITTINYGNNTVHMQENVWVPCKVEANQQPSNSPSTVVCY